MFTGSPRPLLAYRRRAFPWHEPAHPLAQRRVTTSGAADVFRSPATGTVYALVADHVVQGRVIFPGAGYLEMARAAATSGVSLSGVYFLLPLSFEMAGLLVECSVADGRFEVRSGDNASVLADPAVHCSGALVPSSGWQSVACASVRGRSCVQTANACALYDGFHAVGLQYGPDYRTLTQAWRSASVALARLRARLAHDGTQVHPADLDDALCASALVASSGGGETRLPFAVDQGQLQGAPGELWAVSGSGA